MATRSYRITKKTLLSKLFSFCLSQGFLTYYTYAYTTIPKTLLSQSMSICFLIIILLGYVEQFRSIIEIIYTYHHLGQATNDTLWRSIVPIYRYPLAILSWLSLLRLGTGCYIVSGFLPIELDRCDVFSNVPHACLSLKIISIWMMITFSLYGLLFALFFMYAISMRFLDADFSCKQLMVQYRHALFFGVILSMAGQHLPIVNVPPQDKICAICFEEAKTLDQWMILQCKHKFHPNCIQPWLTEHNTCPLCREVQRQI